MAQIKFEEQLKDKLEKRSFSPSSESWSKLAERLDVDQKKSKSPMFWWLSIAAGLLIMTAVLAQLFGAETSEELMPQVVEENIGIQLLKDENQESNTEDAIQLIDENSLKEKNNEASRTIQSKNFYNKQADYKSPEPKIQLAENNNDIKNREATGINETLNKELQKESDALLMKNALAETLNKLKTENNSVTDREIDSLLKLASKELFKEKLKNESIITVDAQSLLMSVQDEMGQSFRSKVFEALKDSYEIVITAVAERNN